MNDPELGLVGLGNFPSMLVATKQTAMPPPAPQSPVMVKSEIKLPNRLFFTGRMKVGKDYSALAAGCAIYGFAEPLYYLAEHFFGVPVDSAAGKNAPGMRLFLQALGQWGRGTLSEQYPVSPLRAVFVTMIKSLAQAEVIKGHSVEWANYGSSDTIWLDACLKRIGNAEGRVAITNCRFENELNSLTDAGFQHWHVLCSAQTWAKRLAADGLKPDAPATKDISEQLAAKMDASVTKKISAQRIGPKLRVIWNDPAVPPPSLRLFTLPEFLKLQVV